MERPPFVDTHAQEMKAAKDEFPPLPPDGGDLKRTVARLKELQAGLEPNDPRYRKIAMAIAGYE